MIGLKENFSVSHYTGTKIEPEENTFYCCWMINEALHG